MSKYESITVWCFKAPVESVWNEIKNTECWPKWWKGVKEVVEVTKGDDLGVGKICHYTWKGVLPYKLRFSMLTTCVHPLKLIEGVAEGELNSKGTWYFFQIDNITVVRYDWTIQTNKFWMNVLSPLARPLFRWNHNVVMRWGKEGLKKQLGITL